MTQSEVVTLREHFEKLLYESDLRNQQAINHATGLAKEASGKAEMALEKRYEHEHELRRSIDDLGQRKVGRDEYTGQLQTLVDRIGLLQTRIDMAAIASGLSLIAMVIVLGAIFLHH